MSHAVCVSMVRKVGPSPQPAMKSRATFWDSLPSLVDHRLSTAHKPRQYILDCSRNFAIKGMGLSSRTRAPGMARLPLLKPPPSSPPPSYRPQLLGVSIWVQDASTSSSSSSSSSSTAALHAKTCIKQVRAHRLIVLHFGSSILQVPRVSLATRVPVCRGSQPTRAQDCKTIVQMLHIACPWASVATYVIMIYLSHLYVYLPRQRLP
jgi:hypothetical protein